MKGVDDFMWVLLIASVFLIIIAAYTVYFPPIPTESVELIDSFSVGKVGFSAEKPTRTILLEDMVVGEPHYETMKALSKVEISRGWSGASPKSLNILIPQWMLSEKKKAVVSFDVFETNSYAPLIIEWNGKQFFAKKALKKHYDVEIPSDYVMDVNTLKVDAGGPGFMFWASTYYDLRSFKVDVVTGPSKLFSFDLLPEELEIFDRGQMEFYATGASPLTVKINGQEFYSNPPAGMTLVDFDFKNATLKKGQNIISLSSPGKVNLFGAQLRLYMLVGEGRSVHYFDISEEEYAKLRDRQGSIRLLIDDVSREGVLKVSLNNNELMETRPAKGWNNITFAPSEALEGENELLFTSTGEFEIAEVDIGIVK
ncbi:MAG: hypothetical protein ABIH90_01115 [Candidatus Aenigmatarchaeota archaeon]